MIPNWDFDTVRAANPTKSRPEASFIQKPSSANFNRNDDRRHASPTRAVSPLAPAQPVPAQPAPTRPTPSPAAATAAAVAASSVYNNDRVPLDPPSDPAPEPPREPAPVVPKPKPASPKSQKTGSGEKSASLYDVVAPILSEMKTQHKYQDCVSFYLPL